MFKILLITALVILPCETFAQTSSAPPSLEVAQQRARFAREQLAEAERKAQVAQTKDQTAQKRLEEAKVQAEQTAKVLQEALAVSAKARERHDQAYQDLKRAHDAMQSSGKSQ